MDKASKDKKVKCKYCGYICEKELIKDHEKLCDKNPESEDYKKPKDLKGIGGWLGFFVFTLIFSIILDVVVGIQDISSTIPYGFIVVLLDVMYWIAILGFGIYTIFSLIKLNKDAVFLAKMYIVIIVLSNLLTIIFSSVTNQPIQNSYSSLGFSSFLYGIIWFLYLSYSERIKENFPKKERRIYLRDKILIFIALAVILVISYLTTLGISNLVSTPISSYNGQTNITEQLSPNYAVYKIFTNQYQTTEAKYEFSSNLPIDVYFVPNETDYNNFMQNQQYNTYQGCLFENQNFGIIDCNVSSGGIIIYNPNSENITYTISSVA